jgi:hypothetical protein
MDDQRFDGIARAWSAGTNRRGAVCSLAVLALAGWRGSQSPGSADAQEVTAARRECAHPSDCRSRVTDHCVNARCVGGRCQFVAVRCAAGFPCCGNGRCCEAAPIPGCIMDADCATDIPCIQSRCVNGVCVTLVVDGAPGTSCCGNGMGCAPH